MRATALIDDWTAPARSQAPRSRARGHRRLTVLVTAAIVLVAASILLTGTVIATHSLRLSPVLSGSMRPDIQPGDLAITEPVPIASLESGDVISFYPPSRTDPVLHRLLTVTPREDGTWITTKGDANGGADPWGEIRLRGQTAWRLVGSVPMVGFVPMWTQGMRGPVLLLAGILLALSGIRAVRDHSTRAMHPIADFIRPRHPRPRPSPWRDPRRVRGRRSAG